MPELGQREFGAGWTPNDDKMSGRVNGLLKMTNLNLDEDGAVRISKGIERVSPLLSGSIRDIYSKELNNEKHRYVALESGSSVVFQKDVGEAGTFGTTIGTGSGANIGAFGSALGQVFMAGGDAKFKDDGTTQRIWGIPAPTTAPTLVAEPPITTEGIS